MASSTRKLRNKLRRQQKEMNRRSRQATRFREIKREEQEEEKRKRIRNLLPTVLGLSSATGYNKNVLSKALESSKTLQTNYLTQTMRKKRLETAKQRFFMNYNESRDGSKLHYAIKKADPYAVKFILAEGTPNFEKKDMINNTPLQLVLNQLLDLFDETMNENIWHASRLGKQIQAKKEKIIKYFEIFDMVVKAGAKVGLSELNLLWSMGYEIEPFLEGYPELLPQSYKYRNEIKIYLQDQLNMTIKESREAEDEYIALNERGIGIVPLYLQEQEEREENAIRHFRWYMEHYNPVTGKVNE